MFTNSSYTKRELTRMAPGGDFRVMPIPVDSDFFTPGERALPMSGKPTRIGLVGRLDDARKNPQLLLEAAAVLVQAGHDLNLIFVGGAANEALSTKAHALGLTSQIAFKADLSMEELRDAYRSFDVLAITSDQEGLGLVGLEAMACGAAVVSTRCGGPEDYILDGTTGLLVDSDKKSLADAVERLISEPRLAQDLARAGQALVRQRYSTAAFTQTLLAALQSTHGLDLHTRDGV